MATNVCFSLLSGGSDGRVCLHDVEDGAVRSGMTTVALKGQSRGANTHTALVSAVSWFPWENSLFITSSYDGSIRVWDPHAMQARDLHSLRFADGITNRVTAKCPFSTRSFRTQYHQLPCRTLSWPVRFFF